MVPVTANMVAVRLQPNQEVNAKVTRVKQAIVEHTSKMPFGKYINQPLENIPRSYWRWMYDNKKLSGELLKYAVDNVPDIKLMEEKKK